MKPLIEFSIEHYESLLKRATQNSRLYFSLKKAVKPQPNTVIVLCDLDEAKMLLMVAKHFCPDAVPEIEKEIRLVERLWIGEFSFTPTAHQSSFCIVPARAARPQLRPSLRRASITERVARPYKSPKGEVGVLRWVSESNIQPANRCFLFIDFEESSYGGVLTVDYHAFCTKIVRFLQAHYDRPIAEIGGLDLPPSL